MISLIIGIILVSLAGISKANVAIEITNSIIKAFIIYGFILLLNINMLI